MRFKKIFLVIALLVTVVSTAQAWTMYDRDNSPSGFNIPDQDRGPSFSSPREEILGNGDVASHYPPYYHPQGDGQ
jgi:hypothetical protein